MATPNEVNKNTLDELLKYASEHPNTVSASVDWDKVVQQVQTHMKTFPTVPVMPKLPTKPVVMKIDDEGVTSEYTGKVLVLYYVAQEMSDGFGSLPKYKVKPFRLPLGSASAQPGMNETRISMPSQLFETEAEAQRECVDRVRNVYRAFIAQFIEKMVLASFESGVCDTPETTLVEALKTYLESIK